jgi:hypothetical protein
MGPVTSPRTWRLASSVISRVAEGALHRLPLEGDASPKKKPAGWRGRFCFSLHADAAVHACDRVRLQRLCG